jgi:hypothetical protein
MQSDVHETFEDLEQHIEEEHSDVPAAVKRTDAKATSPDVSWSRFYEIFSADFFLPSSNLNSKVAFSIFVN